MNKNNDHACNMIVTRYKNWKMNRKITQVFNVARKSDRLAYFDSDCLAGADELRIRNTGDGSMNSTH